MYKPKNVAKAIKELRERHNLTQAELSRKLGWSQGQVSRYEHGATEGMNLHTLCDMLNAFGDEGVKAFMEEVPAGAGNRKG
jgi:transcriptional regulator with XRE-family HTH domain